MKFVLAAVVVVAGLIAVPLPASPAPQAAADLVYGTDSPGVTAPVATREVKPSFPRAVRDAGIQGRIIVDLVVSTGGAPVSLRIRQPLDPRLDAAALASARQWRFRPGTKDGRPVAVRTEIAFTFTVR